MNLTLIKTADEIYPKGTAIAHSLARFAIADIWENKIVIKPEDYYFGFESDYSIESAEETRISRLGTDNVPFSCCTIFNCSATLQRCE